MAGKTKKRAKNSAGSLQSQAKGHLGLKSSPFCTVSSKLTAQVMVQDHMTAHYRMVNSAKSTIDNKTPKAWLSSQKVKDRATREHVKSAGPVRAQWTETTYRPDSQTLLQDYEEMLDVDGPDDYIEYNNTYNPQAAGQTGRLHVQQIMRNSVYSPRAKKQPQDTDLLNRKSHVFTEPDRPFTPRTLKYKNVQSRLSQFKYYNPPKQQPSVKTGTGRGQEKPEPRSYTSTPLPEGEITQEMLHSHDKRFITRRSREQQVPPLDITADTDHMNWLKEQAENAHARAKPVPAPRMQQVQRKTLTSLSENPSPPYQTLKDTSLSHSSVDEELKYLDFIRDVTNDVLERGIFSNRVLKVVFEKHVQRHKNELKMSRMRELLDTLRDDLGIPLYDEEVENDALSFTTTRLHEDLNSMTLNENASTQNNYRNTGNDSTQLDGTMELDVNPVSAVHEQSLQQRKRDHLTEQHNSKTSNIPEEVNASANLKKDNGPIAHDVDRAESHLVRDLEVVNETELWQQDDDNDEIPLEEVSPIGSQDGLDGMGGNLMLSKTIRQPYQMKSGSSLTGTPKRKGSFGRSSSKEMEKDDKLSGTIGMESTLGMDSTIADTLAWGTGTSVWSEVSVPNPLNETHLVHTNKTVHFEKKLQE